MLRQFYYSCCALILHFKWHSLEYRARFYATEADILHRASHNMSSPIHCTLQYSSFHLIEEQLSPPACLPELNSLLQWRQWTCWLSGLSYLFVLIVFVVSKITLKLKSGRYSFFKWKVFLAYWGGWGREETFSHFSVKLKEFDRFSY